MMLSNYTIRNVHANSVYWQIWVSRSKTNSVLDCIYLAHVLTINSLQINKTGICVTLLFQFWHGVSCASRADDSHLVQLQGMGRYKLMVQ